MLVPVKKCDFYSLLFRISRHPNWSVTVQWAVIKGMKGQKGRVAGYVIGNVFYVVFLDQNHRFWVTEKKGT